MFRPSWFSLKAYRTVEGTGIYVGPWKHLSFEDGRLDFSRSHWDGYTSKRKAIYH